ncbi:MAG: hypothetical protein CME32_27910 [Gimesia sp.]|uniref:Uncharacterized protein n=1 Tax=Gimesia chilikensis TaxID=2605989 RepID=A0A517PSS0_9PLAN|nr:hypothetical protein [Gimesia chilikensis]MBN73099.1 hypothetical protein [Gimesia sp.]QDT22409.1 hypothetical protein HG66A1_42170 [Gimesia chilikensis]
MLDHLLTQLIADPENTKLVFMPISRLLVGSVCAIGDIRILPPGEIDIGKFRPIPNKELPASGQSISYFAGQDLREIKTSATGFNCDVLANTPLVVFTTQIDWNTFLGQDHISDLELIKLLSATAERAFDLIRFHFCRFDLPDTLPGKVGSWFGSGTFLGAMLYTLSDNESYLIAGEAIDCSIVAKGLGLDLNVNLPDKQLTVNDGEVASVAIHGLSLLSDVMIASNDTIKFVRAMTLLEFLANPDEFKNWKSLKGDIICHCASNKTEYHELAYRFRELTSLEDATGKQIGLRTLVVHNGRFLTDIVPDPDDRRSLFRELQSFASGVLGDMLENATMSWSEFETFRSEKKQSLGV